MRLPLPAFALLAPLALSACASTGAPLGSTAGTTALQSEPESRPHQIRIELFTEGREFGSIEFDPDATAAIDVEDLDRARVGIRASIGKDEVRGYAQLFGETWDDDGAFLDSEFDMAGIGGGVLGVVPVHHFDDDLTLVVPYRGGLDLSSGEESAGAFDSTIVYAEIVLEGGIGLSYRGFMASIGLHSSSIAGGLETESPFGDLGTDITASNAGGFLELGYASADAPIVASLRVMGGDVEGASLTLGVGF